MLVKSVDFDGTQQSSPQMASAMLIKLLVSTYFADALYEPRSANRIPEGFVTSDSWTDDQHVIIARDKLNTSVINR